LEAGSAGDPGDHRTARGHALPAQWPDGSGESDGNPDEVRTDRYYALESAMQIMGSSLLGLTFQCAKCHDHKFEPITQKDYYSFQSFLYPAFNIEKWVKPNDRVVHANLPGELEAWEQKEKRFDAEQATLKREFIRGLERIACTARCCSPIISPNPARSRNIGRTPRPATTPRRIAAVTLDTNLPPAALIQDGALRIIEGGGSGDRWISTRQSFDWRPAKTGEWIQVSFDLVAPSSTAAASRPNASPTSSRFTILMTTRPSPAATS